MSTLISSTTAWITPAEFFKRADPRTIADIVGDANLRPYQNNDQTINLTLLAADANLLAALAAASGQFEADVFVGQRYTPDDLTLIFNTACNAQAFMWTIIANIARMHVLERRLANDPEFPIPAWYKDTKEMLQRIREGDAIFGFLEHAEAGLPKAQFMQEQDWDRVETTVTQMRKMFGRRNKDFRRPLA
jgi:hypothetical protein